MAESERRRLISSTPHLQPEEVAQRAFTTSRRGYAEPEVRAFLKRISEELVVTRERETELLDAIDSLEEQLRSPRPLDESQLLDALGAETSRLLRSAREAAEEMRTRAEQHAAESKEAALAEAERIRTEAEEFLRTRTTEAEERGAALGAEAEQAAAEVRAAIESFATEERARIEREVESVIEAARQQGREMLDEAKSTRERVLADLFRRRALLQSQIDELRGGRDNLLDAYRVVKRTFLEATGALAQVEARAAERSAATGDDTSDIQLPEHAETGAEAVAEAVSDTADTADESDAAEASDASLADVDSLFARIRAGQAEPAIEPEPPAAPAGPAAEAAGDVQEAAAPADEAPADEAPVPEPEPEPAVVVALDAIGAWRARRAEVIDPLLASVAKRAKRTAQDDQNALLDAVRRHKGRPNAAQVLTPEADLLGVWVGVVREAIDEAYGAGRVAAGGGAAAAADELTSEAVSSIVLPLRERLASAIDAGDETDPGGLVERVGARFREWKNQSLENALADALAMSWSRGVYDAAPDGAVLQWIPLVEGRCADCDDNGLEPTVKGASFPTGQVHPPAHPGCRCLLAPADVLSMLAANA